MTLDTRPTRDATDDALIIRRAAAYDRRPGPRVGDFIDYTDGITRRISHVWPADWHDDNVARVQTTDGGSFYLGGADERLAGGTLAEGEAYVSYSGALYPGIKVSHLTLAGSRNGSVWTFHHDWPQAHNGVDAEIAFRVYAADIAGADPWHADERDR